MKPLTGKVAIITGASAPRGIGCAIAKRLAKDGAAVLITDIDGKFHINGKSQNRMELLENTATEIKAAGGQADTLTVDVTQKNDVLQCAEFAKSWFGRIDILVNNAGSLAGSDNFLETTPAQWETSFQVNLLGPMMLTQAVIPEMQAVGAGSIINIGSTGSLGAEAGFGAYTAMKHALIGMTKTIAAEFG
ncbi:MAG: SDR family oxidoreductase, partial [Amylibacter sp.]|nr:SDR family oxidoreductase [Amylibacter sp.]